MDAIQPLGSTLSLTVDLLYEPRLECNMGLTKRWVQVWKDALAQKQDSPYMRHTLASGTLRDFHFCPYEVQHPIAPFGSEMPHNRGPLRSCSTRLLRRA